MDEKDERELALIQHCLKVFYKFDDVEGLEFTRNRLHKLKTKFRSEKGMKQSDKDLGLHLLGQLEKSIEVKIKNIKPQEVEIYPVPNNYEFNGEK